MHLFKAITLSLLSGLTITNAGALPAVAANTKSTVNPVAGDASMKRSDEIIYEGVR
jgi:hypothetical protein